MLPRSPPNQRGQWASWVRDTGGALETPGANSQHCKSYHFLRIAACRPATVRPAVDPHLSLTTSYCSADTHFTDHGGVKVRWKTACPVTQPAGGKEGLPRGVSCSKGPTVSVSTSHESGLFSTFFTEWCHVICNR